MSSDPATLTHVRFVFTGLLAVYGFTCIINPEVYRLLDGVDLLFHEAGHLVFAPFGEFVGYLGGTLMQLLMPLAFLVSFWRRGERYAMSVVLWWVAQNFWNISVYMRDARTQQLPLVGGGNHDWAYLLGQLDLLHRDQVLADIVHFAGVMLFGYSLVLGFSYADSPRSRPVSAG